MALLCSDLFALPPERCIHKRERRLGWPISSCRSRERRHGGLRHYDRHGGLRHHDRHGGLRHHDRHGGLRHHDWHGGLRHYDRHGDLRHHDEIRPGSLQPDQRRATMLLVKAEELIALETAMRDLARLYESALLFTRLRERAEEDLLPRMSALGALLREQLRHGALGERAIAAAADDLHALTAEWQQGLDAVRTDTAYRATVAAFERDDQPALRRLVPQVFAGLDVMTPPPAELYYAVSLAVPRGHRPGARPFLTATEAADKIAGCRDGIEPDPPGSQWWEQSPLAVSLAEETGALEAPVALALDLRERDLAVFHSDAETTVRIYTPRLVAPFQVVLAAEADDEWWQVSADSYASFRQSLCDVLGERGIAVRMVQS